MDLDLSDQKALETYYQKYSPLLTISKHADIELINLDNSTQKNNHKETEYIIVWYAGNCGSCGCVIDVLRKISAPPPTKFSEILNTGCFKGENESLTSGGDHNGMKE
jgi:hypothetical protein